MTDRIAPEVTRSVPVERVREFCRIVIAGLQPCDYGKRSAMEGRLRAEAERLLEELAAAPPDGISEEAIREIAHREHGACGCYCPDCFNGDHAKCKWAYCTKKRAALAHRTAASVGTQDAGGQEFDKRNLSDIEHPMIHAQLDSPTLPAPTSELDAQPVAWRWHWRSSDIWSYSEIDIAHPDQRATEPLYAADDLERLSRENAEFKSLAADLIRDVPISASAVEVIKRELYLREQRANLAESRLAAARDEGIEAATKVCEAQIRDYEYLAKHGHYDHMDQSASNCAAAIRALSGTKS